MNKARVFAVTALFLITLPSVAAAYPFGGSIRQIIFCYNNAIYTAVGPPRGGPFIWTPSTRTYQYGPPTHSGQWLLGLAAPPYYCLVSRQPIIVWSGVLMTMEGSSGGAAPGGPGGGLGNSSGGGTGGTGNNGGTGGSGTGSGIGHVVVSEVYAQADVQHGGQIQHQWIEIFNGSGASVDLSRWTIRSTSTSQTIPSGTTLPANGYLVLAGTTSVRALWQIPQNTQVLAFPSAFPGFVANGDHVYLQNDAGVRVDAMSWGSDISGYSPSSPTVQLGHALIRKTLASDGDNAQDWVDTAAPTAGR